MASPFSKPILILPWLFCSKVWHAIPLGRRVCSDTSPFYRRYCNTRPGAHCHFRGEKDHMTITKKRLLTAAAVLASVLGLGLIGCSDNASLKPIRIDGSSTVYPITEAMVEEYLNATDGRVPVTVGISGTGGGFKKFCRGEIDITDASRP